MHRQTQTLDARPCRVRVQDGVTFDILVGTSEAAGQTPFGADPLSRAYVQGGSPPNAHLLRLMLALVRPGQTVLDLGAHIGTFALTAAAAGCRVVAVEASPRNAGLLEASIAHNGFADRARVFQVAAGNRTGEVRFASLGPWGRVVEPGQARAAEGVPSVPEVSLPSETIRSVRVSELLNREGIRQVDLVKIDVEGSEVDALEGLREHLDNDSAGPILYESNCFMLWHYGQSPGSLRAALERLGYRHHYLVCPTHLARLAPGETLWEVVAECLATRTPLPASFGWKVVSGPTVEDRARGIATSLDVPQPEIRAYLGGLLRQAPPALLAHPLTQSTLAALQNDDVAEVRAAVGWFRPGRFRPRVWWSRQVQALRQFPGRLLRRYTGQRSPL
jgi:FkbM family methyltransferase